MMKYYVLVLTLLMGLHSMAQNVKTLTVEGVTRKMMVYAPKQKRDKCAVVFVFHGHGGNALYASKQMDFVSAYPQAVVVYMDGIAGAKSALVDKEGLYSGWQMAPGELGDRDVKFFDAAYALLQQQYPIAQDSVYAVGHSNGSRFVNVLWKMRGNVFAGLVTVAAPGGIWMLGAPQKSVWISFGKRDLIVNYALQKAVAEKYLHLFRANLSSGLKQGDATSYQTTEGKEMVIEDRDAGHEFPKESIPAMVAFMKRN